jgi:cysteinyl-tRNA synthetase
MTDVDDVLDVAARRAERPTTPSRRSSSSSSSDMVARASAPPSTAAGPPVCGAGHPARGCWTGAAYAREERLLPRRRRGRPGRLPARGPPAVRRVRFTARRPPKTIRWTRRSGRPARRATRPGTPLGPARRAGTPSAPPWRCRCSARGRRPRHGADPFPHHAYHAAMAEAFTGVRPYARAGCMWGRSPSLTRRWPSRLESGAAEEFLGYYPAAAVRLMILTARRRAGTTGRSCSTRPQPGWRALPGGLAHRGQRPAAVDEMRRLLATELDVPSVPTPRSTGGGPAHPGSLSSASADGPPPVPTPAESDVLCGGGAPGRLLRLIDGGTGTPWRPPPSRQPTCCTPNCDDAAFDGVAALGLDGPAGPLRAIGAVPTSPARPAGPGERRPVRCPRAHPVPT